MYNEVEVKAILIAVHNIENVGLNSKKVLLNSIEYEKAGMDNKRTKYETNDYKSSKLYFQ